MSEHTGRDPVPQPLLRVEGLRVAFGPYEAVRGVDFSIAPGRVLCLVGESGCGKSVTARAVMRLVEPAGRVTAGRILWHGGESAEAMDLAALDSRGRDMRALRGPGMAMIFQEPMSALSPVHTIGEQLTEPMRLHLGLSRKAAEERAVDLLARVGIPNPRARLSAYAFQLSGGMRQRAMIAIALACSPKLLIADEPTTALDVTTQAQVLDLLAELVRELGMAMLFITHDLGVVAQLGDEVAVMYLGRIVERAPVFDLFDRPHHPYTQALLRSVPSLRGPRPRRLAAIEGLVPSLAALPPGCVFHPRCERAAAGLCDRDDPAETATADGLRTVRCHRVEAFAS
ncbi:ABC transporter ATP-binding protein [Elioraea thermophila]|uniref:ABC transporter ATP-binding protein n=1 Tax=Elioraea thermophila TaxID=2185104 RepID=UPI0018E59214|nr:ABC transporter ATP-binding protein [Elioraea thermophila]